MSRLQATIRLTCILSNQDSTSSRSDQGSSGPTSSAPAPTNTPSPDLSTGAKAGIGVGAALGGLIFLVALFLGWRYVKKRRNTIPAQNGGEMAHGDTGPKSYPGEAISGGLHEAHGEAKYNGPYETGAETRGELSGQNEVRRHELYGEER